jgi:hypothetical protein
VAERSWASYLIVLIASGCALVLELVAGRVLAPFVGVSILAVGLTLVLFGMFAGALARRPESQPSGA